ncbi:Mechanosensitive channel MscK precursor [compost metagenome]
MTLKKIIELDKLCSLFLKTSCKVLLFWALLGTLGVYAQTSPTIKKKDREQGLFTEKDTLSDSDYLMSIERANQVVNSSRKAAEFEGGTYYIFGELKQTSEQLQSIITNLDGANNNVHNLQMYKKLLGDLQVKLDNESKVLNVTNDKLKGIRSDIRGIIKDTVLKNIIKDTLLIKKFREELIDLKDKWKSTDSLLKRNLTVVNKHKTETAENKIKISEALLDVNESLEKSGINLFSDEYPRLWSSVSNTEGKLKSDLKQKYNIEQKAFNYYFNYSLGSNIVLLLLLGILFWWINRNIKKLKKVGKYDTLQLFDFKYLNQGILLPVLVIILNIAIASNLYAPALYIDFLHVLLLGSLTLLFRKKWPKASFSNWLFLVLLFVLICFLDLFVKVSFIQRCLFICINIAAIRFGFVQLKSIKDELYTKAFFRWASGFFITLNFLAIIFNLFGRVSVAHTLSLSAVIALTQIITLSVFLKIILETILLQIYTIRITRGIEKIFDYENLSKNLKRPFVLIITYLWIIVIASNLNLLDVLYIGIDNLINHKNKIGSFTFTFGNILLFLMIVWVAHILQKYVAYFFGEIDEEDEESINKRQHSRLLITRLILLTIGYLLAIAASGMPLDKITIVLGALGVGVGLGLQNIVNNFVSGVILIFDKPIQIGDVIEVSSQSGKVKEIGLRSIKIDTSDGAEVIIPNGNLLSENIINWTYSNNYRLVEVSFGLIGTISQEDTIANIVGTLKAVPLVYTEKEPQIFYHTITESKSKISVKFWCSIYRTEQAISEVRVALYNSFKQHGASLE